MYNDGKVKECGNCHKIKLYTEFGVKIIGKEYKDQIEKIYKNLENRIISFEYKTTGIKDPLK